jgi:hypothetical protein
MKTRLLCTLSLLLLSMGFVNAAYVPLTVTSGFNADVIANGVGTAFTTTTADVDAASSCYVSNGWQLTSSSALTTTGLPATGLINSALTTGLSFQLAGYAVSNSLRLQTTGTGTLAFQMPYSAAQNLYILAVSGSGTSSMNVQINFSDGTNQTATGILVDDWYGGANVALTGFQRLDMNLNTLNSNTFPVGPNLYQYAVAITTANQTKQVASVQFTRTTAGGTGTLNVFGVSIQQSTIITCAAPTAPTVTGITTTSAVLNWTQTGTPAQWQIKYGAPGFNVNTGGTSIFTTTKPYTLNPPLTLGTSYDFYVRAVCGVGDTSFWTPVTNFTTLCNATTVTTRKDSFNCGTGLVTLLATTTPGASIKWYAALTGGTALSTGNSYTSASLTATTNFYVTAIIGTCESSPRLPVVATIRPIPVVNIGNDTTICPGIAYTFNAGNPGGTYLWSTGETTQTVTKNAVGAYAVKVTVNECSKTDTIHITPGVAPANNLAGITNLCSGDVATLDAGNVGSTYLWSPGGATTQSRTATTGGTYTVNIKSVDGCKLTSTTNLVIRPLPVHALGNDTSICEGASITLNAQNAGYSYLWNTGASTQSLHISDSGKYVVTITTPYNCQALDSQHVAYLPSPRTEGFNFIPEFFAQLGRVDFSPLNPTNVYSYQWDFGDGSPLVTQMNPSHVYAASGFYNVGLTVYNDCSQFTQTQEINVDLPTGIVTIKKGDINLMIYPNPARTVLNISNKSLDYKMEDVTIFNSLGAIVYHQKASSDNEHQLSVQGFASGMYFVRILTNKGFVSQQIQVTH